MRIINLSAITPHSLQASYPTQILGENGTTEYVDDEVQTEHALDVFVNGEALMRLICSPANLIDLVIGRLFTEGIIQNIEDVDSILLNRHATEAHVSLRRSHPDGEAFDSSKRPSMAKSSKTTSIPNTHRRISPLPVVETHGGTALSPAFHIAKELTPVSPATWNPADIFSLAQAFACGSPMHKRTFGAHSCYIALGPHVLFCREDLGRHNAFDKVIGQALRAQIDLTKATVFTSGRTPVDMVTKALRAGIPLLVSKAVPTDLTIELARKYDLTLICSAHPDSIKVFNDPLGCAARFEHAPKDRSKFDATADTSWKVHRLLEPTQSFSALKTP